MKKPDTLRSARWFAPDDFRSFGHRSRMQQMGDGREDFAHERVLAGQSILGLYPPADEANKVAFDVRHEAKGR
jgi:hypothetical protein